MRDSGLHTVGRVLSMEWPQMRVNWFSLIPQSFEEKLLQYKRAVTLLKSEKSILEGCRRELSNIKKPSEELKKGIKRREEVTLREDELKVKITRERLGKDKELQEQIKVLEAKYGQLVDDADTREMLHLEKELVYEESMSRDLRTAIRNMQEANKLQADINDVLAQDMERLMRVHETHQRITSTLAKTEADIKTVASQEDQKVFWMFCIALALGAIDVLVLLLKFGN